MAGSSPVGGGFKLGAKKTHGFNAGEKFMGRIFGRTGCKFNGTSPSCQTADCGPSVKCQYTGASPVTSAEFNLNGFDNKDFYDVSNVDGFNLPIKITPLGGDLKAASGPYYCQEASCEKDLNPACPAELQYFNSDGRVVGCRSACDKYRSQNQPSDQYCCSGAYNTPQTCPPTPQSQYFKSNCPKAYSYQYDDETSTFTCRNPSYRITFCP